MKNLMGSSWVGLSLPLLPEGSGGSEILGSLLLTARTVSLKVTQVVTILFMIVLYRGVLLDLFRVFSEQPQPQPHSLQLGGSTQVQKGLRPGPGLLGESVTLLGPHQYCSQQPHPMAPTGFTVPQLVFLEKGNK